MDTMALQDNNTPPPPPPPPTHLELKYHKVLFAHKVSSVVKLFSKFKLGTTVIHHCRPPCAIPKEIDEWNGCGNGWNEWNFLRFEFKVIFTGISYIGIAPDRTISHRWLLWQWEIWPNDASMLWSPIMPVRLLRKFDVSQQGTPEMSQLYVSTHQQAGLLFHSVYVYLCIISVTM